MHMSHVLKAMGVSEVEASGVFLWKNIFKL